MYGEHRQPSEWMSQALDGSLPAEELTALQMHLGQCRMCRMTWHRLRMADERLRSAPAVGPESGFSTRLLARLDNQRRVRRRRWLGSGMLVLWAGVFAALWAAVVLTGWWVWLHPAEASTLASAGAQLLDAGARVTRPWYLLAEGLGAPAVALGAGALVAVTGTLAAIWVWALRRSWGWAASMPSGTPAPPIQIGGTS